MRHTIDSFSDISIIYFYSGSSKVRTLYKSGTERLDNPEFLETDFKYFQDKQEFKGSDVLGYLDDQDKTKINNSKLGGIEKYLSTLFPTVIPGDYRESTTDYFSSLINSVGDEIYCFLVPENVSRVVMIDDTGSESKTAIEVIFDSPEVVFSKVLWVMTSYKDGKKTINLSWIAYQGDENPNGKMSEYVLRNDSFSRNYRGYHERNGYLYSNISGSLIGTEKIESRPIYNLFSQGWDRDYTYSSNEIARIHGVEYISIRSGNKGKYPPKSNSWWSKVRTLGWNRNFKYSIGDLARIGNIEYESVEPDNIGNHPYYSRMWVKSEVIE